MAGDSNGKVWSSSCSSGVRGVEDAASNGLAPAAIAVDTRAVVSSSGEVMVVPAVGRDEDWPGGGEEWIG